MWISDNGRSLLNEENCAIGSLRNRETSARLRDLNGPIFTLYDSHIKMK